MKVLTILATIVFATGIASSQDKAAPIRIGVINSPHGRFAAFGKSVNEGLELAAEDINKAGGINGRRVELVMKDDHGEPEDSVEAFQRLAEEKVPLVIGPITTAATLATAKIATKTQIPQLSPIAHGMELAGAGPYTFTIFPTTDRVAEFVAKMAVSRFRSKRVALLNSDTNIGTQASKALRTRLQQAGVEVVADERFKEGDRDFVPILTKIKAAKPDLLVFPSYYEEESTLIARQAIQGLPNLNLVADGGACEFMITQLLGDPPFENLFFVNEVGPLIQANELMQSFVTRYEKRFGSIPNNYAAAAHAALFVAKDALEKGGLQSERMRESLGSVDIQTAFGNVRFEQGMNVGANLGVFKLPERRGLVAVQ